MDSLPEVKSTCQALVQLQGVSDETKSKAQWVLKGGDSRVPEEWVGVRKGSWGRVTWRVHLAGWAPVWAEPGRM